MGDQGAHARLLTRRQRQQLVSLTDCSARQLPRKSAESGIRPKDVLHRKSHRFQICARAHSHGFEVPKQRGPVIPGHSVGVIDDVVAGERADRNAHHTLDSQVAGDGKELLVEPVEDLFAVLDEIHLVDRRNHVGYSQQRSDVRVPASLRLQSARGIHQNHRQIRRRRAGSHVARVLFMARRIGNDEFPRRRFEIAVGDVDGDALLAFRAQPVGEEREIDGAAGTIEAAVPHRSQLIFVHGLGIVKEPSDQRGLAVIYTAGRRKAQHILLQMVIDQMLERVSEPIRGRAVRCRGH